MKILIAVLIYLPIISNILWANDEIVNLEKKLQTASSDKDKIIILNTLSKYYWDVSPVKSVDYGQQALNLSQQSEDKESEAKAFNNIGVAYKNLSDYDKALDYCLKGLKIREDRRDKKAIADSLHHIGTIYDYLGNFDKALEYHQSALKIREAILDKEGIGNSLHNIGVIYHQLNKYVEALEYYRKGLKIREEIRDKRAIGGSLNNIGMIHKNIINYTESLDYYQNALNIFEEIGDKYQTANISNNIGELYMYMQNYRKASVYLENALNLAEEIGAKELIRENYSFYSDLYAKKGDYKKSLEYYKLSSEVKDSIFNTDSRTKIADMQNKYEMEKKEKEIQLLKKDNEINQLALSRQKILKNSLLGGLAFVLILVFVIYNRYRLKKKAHAELEEVHRLITLEKAKSDKLLLNILPVRVADDLKEKGKTDPESFENVTVYFSDIVGFTKLSGNLEPKLLIDELNEIFTAFDNIIEKNQCERIKTIGDAYLCVCGMPMENLNHAENIVRSATEIIQYLKERNQTSEIEWKIRVGIHTGKVVGGVVGIKKYIYDVFGDTINTASRMESNSEPMKINLSEATYHLVKDKFRCTERDTVSVKGKGEMKMYFVE